MSVATPGGNISPGPISTTATSQSSTTASDSSITGNLPLGELFLRSTDSTAASTSDSGGLSEDGKTAIATAVPLGVLAIIATFLAVCFKKQLESLGERFFNWLRR